MLTFTFGKIMDFFNLIGLCGKYKSFFVKLASPSDAESFSKCSKSSNGLKKHLRVNSEEKPYYRYYSKCNNLYSSSSHLKKLTKFVLERNPTVVQFVISHSNY